jgi:hypothetical protein
VHHHSPSSVNHPYRVTQHRLLRVVLDPAGTNQMARRQVNYNWN